MSRSMWAPAGATVFAFLLTPGAALAAGGTLLDVLARVRQTPAGAPLDRGGRSVAPRHSQAVEEVQTALSSEGHGRPVMVGRVGVSEEVSGTWVGKNLHDRACVGHARPPHGHVRGAEVLVGVGDVQLHRQAVANGRRNAAGAVQQQ